MAFENGRLIVEAMRSPVLLQLGPLSIRWYALAYLAGLALGWLLLKKMLDRPAPPLTRDQLADLVFWVFLGVLLGGRLGYILFYAPAHYAANPLDILKIWEGGMSFHGGGLGVIAAILLFARRHRLEGLRIFDYVVVVQPAGQFLGRLANFLNGELWGAPTAAPWGVIFRVADPIDIPRHPTQLYEAFFEGLVLLALMNLLFWRTDAARRPGLLAGIYLVGYGTMRFMLEFVREPDRQLIGLTGPLHMGQWLCLVMIALGLWLIGRQRRALA